jgi:glycosyltransferase involved in cell wall biosynthesis
MKILVLPRDPNPYQSLLYSEIERFGVQISYIGELTPSKTLNLLLLPVEIVGQRIAGARLVHVHWVFAFALPGGQRFPVIRWAAYLWFLVWIRTCRMLAMHIIWTAHNVLPHEPVFADDRAARRVLVGASDLVLAHSQSALAELAALGAVPRRSAVIQHGPIAPVRAATPLRRPGTGDGPRRFLFFGRIRDYKGVENLLAAFAAIPDELAVHLTVAGQCNDADLRSRLQALSRRASGRVWLRLEHVPEKEVTPMLAAADVVVLPFRQVTTSGSVMVALSHGRPLIVPDLPGMVDLPDQAVCRYNGQVGPVVALTAALVHLARVDSQKLAAMSAAASGYASRVTWPGIAAKTLAGMLSVLDDGTQSEVPGRLDRCPVK